MVNASGKIEEVGKPLAWPRPLLFPKAAAHVRKRLFASAIAKSN
ncbi:hypothetical protein M728_005331 (plasmid) [Ensifer sp. WSM1721]|nr:hypothetical protein [Ensifer sp. WSM1721]